MGPYRRFIEAFRSYIKKLGEEATAELGEEEIRAKLSEERRSSQENLEWFVEWVEEFMKLRTPQSEEDMGDLCARLEEWEV